jgi:hypothetical protein
MSVPSDADDYLPNALNQSLVATNAFKQYFELHKAFGVDGKTWDSGVYRSYLPQRAQDGYVTKSYVDALLRQLYPPYNCPQTRAVLNHREILIVLLYIGRVHLIHLFIGQRGLQHLPLRHQEDFPCSREVFEEFNNAQWKFCIYPIRHEHDEKFEARQIMPFDIVKHLGDGHSGQAYLIQIHEGYDHIMPASDRGTSLVPPNQNEGTIGVSGSYLQPDSTADYEKGWSCQCILLCGEMLPIEAPLGERDQGRMAIGSALPWCCAPKD